MILNVQVLWTKREIDDFMFVIRRIAYLEWETFLFYLAI